MHHNSTSSLRGGFHYQDLCVLKLCGEWLLNPDSYQWIKIEYKISEDGKFYFDDVVMLDRSDKYHVYQAKFKLNNTDQWKWDDFLEKKNKNQRNSLFEQFSISFKKVGISEISKATFITNADLSEEIKKFMVEDEVNIASLKLADPELYNKIALSFENQTEILNKLKFQFENKSNQDLDLEIRNFFYDCLKATKAGVDNLLLKLKEEAGKPHISEITIQNLREWCQFDVPKSLNEEFQIPNDFQLFDPAMHEKILSDLKKKDGGIKIIHGKPGVGKSTYLSNLSKELNDLEFFVIKHHYHINPADDNFYDRLNSERVAEAIKAQFKDENHKHLLGDVAHKNSAGVDLKDFISRVANNLSESDLEENLIIIIDGLDHVVREKDIGELSRFIEEIFYPQKRLWIIFGTQPQIEEEPLIQQKFSKCLEEDCVEIKGLTKEGLSNLVLKNEIELNLPDDERTFNGLINKLYEITEGNCLHLRYILAELKNNLGGLIVHEHTCQGLISYGGDIEKYYADLWRTLDGQAKSFLLTFISIGFQFTQEQFLSCISSFGGDASTISANFNKVKHLIHSGKKLRIYHNSFSDFLKKQNEWEEQKLTIQKNVRDWLKESKYENLQWSELRALEYTTGNADPILKVDRKWLIEAILHPRNPNHIKSQLELCFKAALGKNDFAKSLEASSLNSYHQNAQQFNETANNLIWIETLNNNSEFIDELHLSELPTDVLVEVANIAENSARLDIVDEILEVILERQNAREDNDRSSVQHEAIVSVVSHNREHQVDRVFKYISQFRNRDNKSEFFFRCYATKLLILDQKTKVNELLKCDLTESERKSVLSSCISYDFKHKTADFKNTIEHKNSQSPLEKVYLHLQLVETVKLPDLPKYDYFPLTLKEWPEEHSLWSERFYDFFLTGLIYTLSGNQIKLEKWVESASNKWAVQAVSALFKGSSRIGNSISTKSKIDYRDIFLELQSLPDIKWSHDDRGYVHFKKGIVAAVQKILKVIIDLKYFLNDFHLITKSDYEVMISTPFFQKNEILKLATSMKNKLFEDDVCSIISDEEIKVLKDTINYLADRSESYIELVKLNRIHGNHKRADELLYQSVNNFIGYGGHKDMYLYEVLDALEAYTESPSSDKAKVQKLTSRIIPLIMHVGEYTNGDETRHLPDYLADFFAKNNKELLFKFSFDRSKKEGSLYPAQETFCYVIRSLLFAEDIEIALATTALDEDSFNELKKKAEISEGAKIALDKIQNYLGEISYKDEKYSSSPLPEEKEIKYSEILPENLGSHLNAISTQWDLNKYLIGWIKYWLDKGNKKEIYTLVKSIIFKGRDANSIDGELLDVLYPLAYEFDNTEAYKILSLAQKNYYGWDTYYTSEEKAKKRWEFLRNKYPNKYLEFFKDTLRKGLPIARGAKFFAGLDKIKPTEEITEAGIKFAEDSTADLTLPIPDWAKENYQKIDELDLLFQRLVWPSPLVRERAANAIGELLVNSSKNHEIYSRLLQWIEGWKVETIITIGLLPIVRAFQICYNTNDLNYIKVNDIKGSIKVVSVVIEKILIEIARYTKEEPPILEQPPEPSIPPISYEVSEFFNKNIQTILPPIYLIKATELEDNFLVPNFIKKWCYNAELIAKENNIEISFNYHFYARHSSDKLLTGLSTKVSEVFRSAYLRLVNGFSKYRPGNYYSDLPFKTLPIDLSLWPMLPNQLPDWWPELLKEKEEGGGKPLIQNNLKTPIRSLALLRDDQNIILAAEGAIKPGDGWKNNPEHSFSLIGFGYKVLGSERPDPKQVYKKIAHLSKVPYPSLVQNPLGFFGNKNVDLSPEPIVMDDLEILPIIMRNWGMNISIWQHFRNPLTSMFGVANHLSNSLIIKIQKDHISYRDVNEKNIALYKDWLAGFQERYESNMPTPYGHHLTINEEFIVTQLKKNDFRLGYVLNTTFTAKQYGHGKAEKIENFEFINVSNLIIC